MARMETKLRIDLYVGSLLHFLLKPWVIVLGKVLGRNHDLQSCRDVTYLKLLGGGSVVMAYPSLLAMKANPRIKKLRLVATPKTAPFGRALGVFDEIIEIRDDNLFHLAMDSLEAIGRLFRTDAIVDLEIHSRLSTVFCLLTMARNRIGAYTSESFWRRGLATHLLFHNKNAGVYLYYDQVAELFGSAIPDFASCVEHFRGRVGSTLMKLPEAAAGDVAIAPCCSDLGRERILRDDEWAEVLQGVLAGAPGESGAQRVHMLGGAADAAALERLAGVLVGAFPAVEFVNHAGKLALMESAGLLTRIGELICIDSALLHLARLLGVNTTSYWGPTDPTTRLRPGALGKERIHYGRIACSPCVHIANEAPCKGNNVCMRFAVNPSCRLDPNPIWLLQLPSKRKDAHEQV